MWIFPSGFFLRFAVKATSRLRKQKIDRYGLAPIELTININSNLFFYISSRGD